uniref:Uncharacterized protein n=1 Tax=Oryza brachyantha TaxID=4533 RepID=J3M8K9_ORYBR
MSRSSDQTSRGTAPRRAASSASSRIRSQWWPASRRASRTSPPPALKGGASTTLAVHEPLTRPVQEALIKDQSPDALVTDVHFSWNAGVAEELGVPCVSFLVVGLFSELTMRLLAAATDSDSEEVTVAGFPGARLRIPMSELPEFLTSQRKVDGIDMSKLVQGQQRCHAVAVNTFLELERPYYEKFVGNGFAKRAYLVGSICLPEPPAEANGGQPSCISWLDSKPSRSVGRRVDAAGGVAGACRRQGNAGKRMGPVDVDPRPPGDGGVHDTLRVELAAGGRGVRVPLLTWPLVFDQFIEERLVTDVLRIGERVWDGPRSVRYEQKTVVPAAAVARAVARFLEPGGAADTARLRAQKLAAEAHAAVAEGGSSYGDLRKLIDDLVSKSGRRRGRNETSVVYTDRTRAQGRVIKLTIKLIKLAQSNGGSARIIQWNVSLADELSVPGVLFLVTGAFSTITLGLIGAVRNDAKDVTVPIFPGRELRILTTELPEFLRTSPQVAGRSEPKKLVSRSRPSSYFGAVVNTFFDLEGDFCEMYVRDNHAKRAYFVGPVSPPPLPESGESPCLDLLSSKSARSVVYACFGSLAHVSEAQLDELALARGLEAAEKPILWVVRTHGATGGHRRRAGRRGLETTGWSSEDGPHRRRYWPTRQSVPS